MKQILVLLFFSLAAFSQKTDRRTLLAEGGAAFGENNFVLAKEIYTKAIALDYKNRDAWYNLAAAGYFYKSIKMTVTLQQYFRF